MFRREITPSGERSLKKLPREVRRALLDASAALEEDPFRAGERLHGPLAFLYSFHLKIQNVKYRMAYTIDTEKQIVLVHYIGPREGFYDRLLRHFGR